MVVEFVSVYHPTGYDKNGPFHLRAQGMQLVLITRDVKSGVRSSHVWLWCARVFSHVLA